MRTNRVQFIVLQQMSNCYHLPVSVAYVPVEYIRISSVNSILKHGLCVNPTPPTILHESIILYIMQRSCFGGGI